MTSFAEVRKADVALCAADPYLGFESVTYYPLGDLAAPREGRAHVLREDLRQIPETQMHNAKRIELLVPIDATIGLTTITPERDKVRVALRVGVTPVVLKITKLLSQDHGLWHVEAFA